LRAPASPLPTARDDGEIRGMIILRVRLKNSKRVRVSGIDPLVADCLSDLPHILEQRDAPAARARLFPNPNESDAEANNDWQSFVAPELRHLFLSAGEIVERDLTSLQASPGAVFR